MESIISNLFISDKLPVEKAGLAVQQPDEIPRICEIIVTSEEPETRLNAAVLLCKHIDELRNWQAVPLQQQAQIKQCTLNAILNETEKTVRNAIAQTIGVLVKHEFAKNDEWCNEVLKIICVFTRSDDAQKSELGSSVFEILTNAAPDQLIPHMEPICEMFLAAMISTAESGNMSTPVILNILSGMSNVVHFVVGRNGAEATYQKSIPYVVKVIESFAQDPENFIRAFDMLEHTAVTTPKLLTPHLNTLIEFSLNTAHNTLFRIQFLFRVVQFIGLLVKLNKEIILRNKLLERIIGVVFMLMGTSSDDGESDDDEYYDENGNENFNSRRAATEAIVLLALHVDPQKLIPPLLQFIETALQNPDRNQKRAAYLCLAVIAERYSKEICAKYWKLTLNCIKTGIVDPSPLARNAALFALCKFLEHLQPDTSNVKEILSIFFESFHQLCPQIRSGVSVKYIHNMSLALYTYIDNLKDAILPHLPVLMEWLFEILRPENAFYLHEVGLLGITCVANEAKTQMMPYIHQIIEILKLYFVQSDDEYIVKMQPQAIDTLTALARTIGKENFMPLTNDTITFALSLLKNASDPVLRTSLYYLFAALATVVNAKMAPVLKKMVEAVLNSVGPISYIPQEVKEDDGDGVAEIGDNDENEEDIDIENSNDDVIAERCSKAICAKYLKLTFHCIETVIVDPSPFARRAAFFALAEFSKHLQPDILKNGEEILPILFEFLHQLCLRKRSGDSVKHIVRMFFALDTYIEEMEDAILPHLPVLMECLFEILRPVNSFYLREFGLLAITCVANEAKTQMLQYIQQIIEILKLYFVQSDNEDIVKMQPQAIDILAALARTTGKENFMPFANDTMTFAITLLNNASYPMLQLNLYNLFAALAELLNAEMAPVLTQIVDAMLNRVTSTDDTPPEFKEDNADRVAEIGHSDEDEEDVDMKIFNDKIDYDDRTIPEKEGVVWALKQLAEFSGPAFVPYLSVCFENIYKLLDCKAMRKPAFEALAQFIVSLNQNNDNTGVQNGVAIFVPRVAEIIKDDLDCEVVTMALDSYGLLLDELGQKEIFTEELKMTIFTCIQNVLTSAVSDQLYEYDELIEAACNVVHKFGGALSPDEFLPFFRQIVPILVARIEKSLNSKDNETERSAAYRALWQCFQPLHNRLGEWFETFLTRYLHGLKDEFSQVRYNCAYGLIELLLHSGEVASAKFPMILPVLSAVLAQETDIGMLDNICAALARLIKVNFKLIPLEQVLPFFFQNLPLRKNFGNNYTIFNCFTTLWAEQPESLLMVLDGVITVGVHVLLKNQYKEGESMILNLLQDIRLKFSDRFNQVVNTDPEIARFVQTW